MATGFEKLESILNGSSANTSATQKITLPNKLPDTFEDPALQPKFTSKPDRQLEEFRVRSAAKAVGLDPHLAAAVAQQESGFNPNAMSVSGVKGTMQVTKKTAESQGFNRDNPDENILAGVTYLKNSIDQAGGNIKKGLSAYPDPKDWPSWSKNVMANYQQSTSGKTAAQVGSNTLEGILDQAGVPKFQKNEDTSQFNYSPEQAAEMNKGVKFVQGPLPDTGSVPEKLLGAWSSYAGNRLTPKDPVTGEELNPELAAIQHSEGTKAAEANPSSAFWGSLGLSMIPNSPESLMGSALLGPVINKLLGKPLKKSGQAVGNIFLKEPLGSQAGETLAQMGPKLTSKGIQETAQKGVQTGEKMIQNVIESNPEFKLSLSKIAQDPDLMNLAIKYDQAGETAAAKRMINKLASFEKQSLDAADANQLRKTLWELSKYTTKGDVGSSVTSQFNNLLGQKVRQTLINELGPEYESALAMQAKNMPVLKAMEKAAEKTPSWFNGLLRTFGALHTGGLSEIPQHAVTATPTAWGLYNTGKGIEAISPQIGAILSALGLSQLKENK